MEHFTRAVHHETVVCAAEAINAAICPYPVRGMTLNGCLVCGGLVLEKDNLIRCNACATVFRIESEGWLSTLEKGAGIAYPEEGAKQTLQVEDTSFWFQHRNHVLETILDRFQPGGPLWDIGGGNGFQALHFQQQGRAVVLVEPGLIGCRNASRRGVENIVCGTLEAAYLPTGLLAAASLFDVIEHLADPLILLKECHRVLRPGGRLYVTVPAFEFLWSDEDIYACHKRRYTRQSLMQHLDAAGFTPEYVSYYFQVLVLPILLLRALPYRLAFWRKEHIGETMDQSEHSPGGALQKLIGTFLARELEAIRRGMRLRYGSSLIAVAIRP